MGHPDWVPVVYQAGGESGTGHPGAEQNLPESKVPLALADCCTQMGRAYDTGNNDDAKKWYAEAKKWYEKARAAEPDNLLIIRRFTQFLLDTKQMSEAKSRLEAMLKKGAGAKPAGTDAWARRTLALVLASDTDFHEVRRALSLFEPGGQPAAPGQEGKTLDDPEDLRILAQVLDRQGRVRDEQRTPLYRKRAIEILESLADSNLANADDRFLLAWLLEISGDWPKARVAYRDLNLRTTTPRDPQTLNHRPYYLDRFAEGLLRHRSAGEKHELTEAQELVNELKRIQPNALTTLVRQVEIYLADNQPESAAKLIEECAEQPNLSPQVLKALAEVAEKLGQLKSAEKVYRQIAATRAAPAGTMRLALFLGRHRRVKEALDICEPLWANLAGLDVVIGTCYLVLDGQQQPDQAQLDRVAGWLERALDQPQNQRWKTVLLACLGSIREGEKLYQKAKELYERCQRW